MPHPCERRELGSSGRALPSKSKSSGKGPQAGGEITQEDSSYGCHRAERLEDLVGDSGQGS